MSTTLESPKTLNLALQLDADQRTSWLAHLFRPFSNEGMDDLLDWRFLGVSALKSSTFGIEEVSFFELSVPLKKQQDQQTTTQDESCPPSITTGDSFMKGKSDQSTTTHPRNTAVTHSNKTVVMSLDTQVFKPSKRQPYYLFPSDAIVEKVSQTPPYELFCSFHAFDTIQKQQGNGMAEHPSGSLNKQQCYTDFPSSPLLSDTTTPDVKMEQSVIKGSLLTTHLSLSGISKELYLILKDSVARFEAAYEKMIQLMKLHTQGLSHRCAELLLTDGQLVQSKKSKSELKINKGKRKGSYPQRQISPRTPLASTTFVSSTCLSSKAKPMPSPPSSSSPPMATTTVSTPITPSTPLPSTASSTSSPRQSSTAGRKCFYCGSKTTPMWRRGPDGAGTLCNACGVKWKHGKILCGRPIDAGGFVAEQQKKRKQHVQAKLKKDKRIKRQQQQHGSAIAAENLNSNDDDDDDDDDDEEEEEEEEDNFSYEGSYDEDEEEEEQMKHNIVAARHLSIHESPQHPYYTSSSLPDDSTLLYPPEPYAPYNGQQPYYGDRPRRHTADVSVLERGGPWVDYPLSMGVDAVEAATVLTLLKRSSQT